MTWDTGEGLISKNAKYWSPPTNCKIQHGNTVWIGVSICVRCNILFFVTSELIDVSCPAHQMSTCWHSFGCKWGWNQIIVRTFIYFNTYMTSPLVILCCMLLGRVQMEFVPPCLLVGCFIRVFFFCLWFTVKYLVCLCPVIFLICMMSCPCGVRAEVNLKCDLARLKKNLLSLFSSCFRSP